MPTILGWHYRIKATLGYVHNGPGSVFDTFIDLWIALPMNIQNTQSRRLSMAEKVR
jgi:hypothetical protein